MDFRAFLAALVVLTGAVAANGCESFGETDPGVPMPADAASSDARLTPPDGATGAAPRSCTGRELFSDAFSRTSAAGNGWVVQAGSPAIAMDAGREPPSLFASTGAVSGTETSRELVKRDFEVGGAPEVCIELDAFVEGDPKAFGPEAYAEIVTIRLNPQVDPDDSLYFEIRQMGMTLAGGGQHADVPFTYGTWQHVVFHLRFGSTTSPTVQVGEGVAAIGRELGPAPALIAVELGSDAYARETTAGAVNAYLDNFVVTVSP